ncbi:type-2 ice-structuring protein-like isoform X2 [Phyllopteryx taeniolatus]|uniref:type-2 ice-structuring protein-like isoform X2 n=1 Tax=Phyllopteryx taeniolatus TaxID=161469 RepID=UPI002AD2A099|nr:type-2 ice-structuring protein-like isoform X2 [Phyllopteryx taeniolatus]XP_061627207.1 type-2 ice-structuring protein-like isoform X2 [Phyllopteryx taeniolatus]
MLTGGVVLCAIAALATAQDCPPAWTEYNKRCFYYDATVKTWVEAQAHCQLFGGNLASVHSDDENAFIRTLTQGTTWLGGSNCQTTGAWLWMDGTQMLFRFWCPLKPDNDLTQCCLQTNTGVNKCWDDVPCSAALPFVCARPL